MKAIVFQEPGKVRFDSTAEPRIEDPRDVIIAVDAAAICGSDLHPYLGRERGIAAGAVMGHEAVGTVVTVGADVTAFRPGDRVITPFTTNCGRCFYCKKGLTCRCIHGQLYGWVENGVGLQGVQAEHARIPLADSTLVKVPEGIGREEALLLGDVLPTGYFCAEMAEVGPGGIYAVVGCGPVGLMAVLAAKERGAEEVYAIDLVRERLDLAEKFGARPLHATEDRPLDVIRGRTEGRGADAVMELVGSVAAEQLAFDLLRPGGILAVAGVHTSERFSFSPPAAYNKNLTYRVGRCPARAYMQRLLPLVKSSKYELKSIFSHRVPLSEGPDAYRLFADKKERCTKVLLETKM